MLPLNEEALADDLPPPSAEWVRLLSEFRGLGGVAENVVLRQGPSGTGLFPADPVKPFHIRVPENLFFRARDVEFADDIIRIADGTGVSQAERDFFESYQKNWSWGGGGQSEAAALVSLFDALPPGLRATLGARFGMQGLFGGERFERIRGQFIRRRVIHWNNERFLIPVLELANHGDGGVAFTSGGQGRLGIKGETQGEIRVNFGLHDALGTFRKFGLASARPHALSVPVITTAGTRKLTILRELAGTTDREGFRIPVMRVEGSEISLSHLMIGNANFPRVSRAIFYRLMQGAGAGAADEAFDRVLHLNRQRYLGLLEALEPLEGEAVGRLRSVAHLQLEAMAHCVGTREL